VLKCLNQDSFVKPFCKPETFISSVIQHFQKADNMNVKMPTLTFEIETIFTYNEPTELNISSYTYFGTAVGWKKGQEGGRAV
jgi:hypothetical protein